MAHATLVSLVRTVCVEHDSLCYSDCGERPVVRGPAGKALAHLQAVRASNTSDRLVKAAARYHRFSPLTSDLVRTNMSHKAPARLDRSVCPKNASRLSRSRSGLLCPMRTAALPDRALSQRQPQSQQHSQAAPKGGLRKARSVGRIRVVCPQRKAARGQPAARPKMRASASDAKL